MDRIWFALTHSSLKCKDESPLTVKVSEKLLFKELPAWEAATSDEPWGNLGDAAASPSTPKRLGGSARLPTWYLLSQTSLFPLCTHTGDSFPDVALHKFTTYTPLSPSA